MSRWIRVLLVLAAALRRLVLRWSRGRPLVATAVLDAPLLRHNDSDMATVAHELGRGQRADIWKGIGDRFTPEAHVDGSVPFTH